MPSVKISLSAHPVQPPKIKNPHGPPTTTVPDPPPIVPPTVDTTPASIAITPTTSGPTVGGTVQMSATVYNAASTVLTGVVVDAWHSSNTGVATVNTTTGLVTTVAEGVVLITATITTPSLTSNTCTMTVKVPEVGTNLARATFEDGTFGLFTNPWGTGIDVIADPTARATGKVARIHYQTFPPTNTDSNLALFPGPVPVISLGGSIWFSADVFVPAGVSMDNGMLRKLFRFGWAGTSGFPVELELVAHGSQFGVQNEYGSLASSTEVLVSTAVAQMTAGAWHHLILQLQLNSTVSATNGIARIWYDNILIWERTAERWSDPAISTNAADFTWSSWGVGYQAQRNDGIAIDEYRYWDNLSFASTQGAL